MQIKNYFLLLFFGLSLSALSAQSVIGSDGDYIQASTYSLEYTVGEVVIETLTGTNVILTQGFHQPTLTVVGVDDPLRELGVKVFPNPTAGRLSIQAIAETEAYHWQLSNVAGQVLLRSETAIENPSEELDLTSFPAGTYYLRLRSIDETAGQTFKLIKIK